MNQAAHDDSEDSRLVERVGLYSFLVNLGLAGLKAGLAHFSASLAITASAIDSATDAVASLAVWGGLKLSTRKNRAFPYGLYKIENFIQVFMALCIFSVGYEMARMVFGTQKSNPEITLWVVAGMLLGVLIPFLAGWYSIRIGRRTGSPALIADGRHRQADVFSTAIVLGAVLCDYFGLQIDYRGLTLDHAATALVLVFVGYAGLELLTEGMRALLDASIDAETLTRVRKIIESEPVVKHVQSLAGRSAGRYRFLEINVVLRIDDLSKAHTLSNKMEEDVRARVPNVDRVLIHYEPAGKETVVFAVPLEADKETISAHFGEAPFFFIGVLRSADGEILDARIAGNPFKDVEKAKGIVVSKWLLEQGIDRVYSTKSLAGKGSGYALSDAGVEIVLLDATAPARLKPLIESFVIRCGSC